MKILFTSDIHASNTHLYSMISIAEREKIDCLIIGGDVVPHYLPDTAGIGVLKVHGKYLEDVFIPVITDFKKRTSTKIYLDLGNDDFICNRKILEEYDGRLINLLHFRKNKLTDDVDIIGYMNVPPTPFKLKDWEKPDSLKNPCMANSSIITKGYISTNGILEETVINLASNDTIERDLYELSKVVDRPFIFISHSPPHKTPLDVIYNGQNVGSVSIKRFIEQWSGKGLLMAAFHGHIHESPQRSGSIQTKIGKALCVNPGQGNGEGAEFRYVIFGLSGNRIFLQDQLGNILS